MGSTLCVIFGILAVLSDGVGAAPAAAVVKASTTTMMQELYRLAKEGVTGIDDPPESCGHIADTPCANSTQCGKGWLYRHQQLLVVIPPWAKEEVAGLGTGDNVAGDGEDWYAGEPRTVMVLGLRDGGEGEESDCNSQDLSLLLRLQGPEAFAEPAVPVEGRCAWTAEFRPLIDGVYTFDATVINWRGGLETDQTLCNKVPGEFGNGSVRMEPDEYFDFKAVCEGCCAMCTRLDGCVAWTGSDKIWNGTERNRCILYSSVSGDPLDFNDGRGFTFSGTPRAEDVKVYLGPQLPFGGRWCAHENTQLMGTGKKYKVLSKTQETQAGEGDAVLPLCRSTEDPHPAARWVSLEDLSCDYPAGAAVHAEPPYDPALFGVTMPAECWVKHQRTDVNSEDYVWEPYSCRYDLMDAESQQKCFEEKGVSTFLEYGDSMILTSGPERVDLWLPNANTTKEWQEENSELGESAGCLKTNYGRYLEDKGGATYPPKRYCLVRDFAEHPPEGLPEIIEAYKPDVVVANWGLLHHMWHESVEEWEDFLEDLGKDLDGMKERGEHQPRFKIWLPSPFVVGERQPQVTLERGVVFNAALRRVLEPRGWIEVDYVTMTRKWSLETMDGLHHDWQVRRMLAYVMTHQICHTD